MPYRLSHSIDPTEVRNGKRDLHQVLTPNDRPLINFSHVAHDAFTHAGLINLLGDMR